MVDSTRNVPSWYHVNLYRRFRTDVNRAELVQQLRDDRIHGATELTLIALQGIPVALDEASVDPSGMVMDTLRELAGDICRVRPAMVSLNNVMSRLVREVSAYQGDAGLLKWIALVCSGLADTLQAARSRITSRMLTRIEPGETIMTHSVSSQIRDIFAHASEKGIKAVITESRPGNEGHDLARFLSELHIETTLITESQINLFMPETDRVILGADAVLGDGSVVNKAGSSLMALSARYHQVPLHVCADQFKMTESSQPVLEEMDPQELGVDLEHVHCRNFYFDVTPAALVPDLITDL